jgi:hypothetical protein
MRCGLGRFSRLPDPNLQHVEPNGPEPDSAPSPPRRWRAFCNPHWWRERECKPTLSRPKSIENPQNCGLVNARSSSQVGAELTRFLGPIGFAPASGFQWSRRTAPRLILLKAVRRFGSATTIAVGTRVTSRPPPRADQYGPNSDIRLPLRCDRSALKVVVWLRHGGPT